MNKKLSNNRVGCELEVEKRCLSYIWIVEVKKNTLQATYHTTYFYWPNKSTFHCLRLLANKRGYLFFLPPVPLPLSLLCARTHATRPLARTAPISVAGLLLSVRRAQHRRSGASTRRPALLRRIWRSAGPAPSDGRMSAGPAPQDAPPDGRIWRSAGPAPPHLEVCRPCSASGEPRCGPAPPHLEVCRPCSISLGMPMASCASTAAVGC
jgi:hypothetical protein